MKNLKYLILTISSFLLFTSCDRELDIDSEQGISTETAISTPEGIQQILIGAYKNTGDGDLFGGDVQIYGDLLADDGYLYWWGTYAELGHIHEKNIISDNVYARDTWARAYKVINATNVVLENLSVVKDGDDKKRIEGEAKFLRALNYFELVRLYGKQYEAGKNNSQLGVPIVLKTTSDFNGDLSVARNSVEEVYTQVVKDLKEAITNLPTENSFYADVYSAQALLSRVYLQKGDYTNARNLANDVIENSGKSLMSNYKDAFNTSENISEDLFAMQVTSQSGENDLILYYADEPQGGRGGDITLTEDFLDLFESDDVRGSFYYYNYYDDVLTSKYTNQYGNIHVIRLAEMYLIRAETNYRLGTSLGAAPLDDINAIRNRANASELTSVNLDDILLERRRELAFEGFLIHDIKRTKGNVGSLNWNSDKLVFPIPLREMQVNSKLVQNPGYN
jgi:hypothetical protein